jgi:hypothetical protein
MKIAAGHRCYYGSEHNLKSIKENTISEIKICETMLNPVVMYGCETWAMTRRDVKYMSE